jgi:hypothetical protein
VFVISLQRDNVTMYLLSTFPLRWTERKQAMRFRTKGDARAYAAKIKSAGVWSIEPLDPPLQAK